MENVSNRSPQEQLHSYAHELYRRAHFLFQRRQAVNANSDATFDLNDDEVAFVAPAFIDNFLDAPDAIEITLLDGEGEASNNKGVLVITEHEDHDSIYSALYMVSARANASETFVTKEVRRLPKETPPEDAAHKAETFFEDVPLDESERTALMAMISKL